MFSEKEKKNGFLQLFSLVRKLLGAMWYVKMLSKGCISAQNGCESVYIDMFSVGGCSFLDALLS